MTFSSLGTRGNTASSWQPGARRYERYGVQPVSPVPSPALAGAHPRAHARRKTTATTPSTWTRFSSRWKTPPNHPAVIFIRKILKPQGEEAAFHRPARLEGRLPPAPDLYTGPMAPGLGARGGVFSATFSSSSPEGRHARGLTPTRRDLIETTRPLGTAAREQGCGGDQ